MNKFLLALLIACAADANCATLDAQGNYVITFRNAAGTTSTFVFVPRNKVAPAISVSVSGIRSYTYTFQVLNRTGAAQDISALELPTAAPFVSSATAPTGFAFTYDQLSTGLLLRWNSVYETNTSITPTTIRPGQAVLFTVQASYLAGIANMRSFGYVADAACITVDCTPVFNPDGSEREYPDLDAELEPLLDISVDVPVATPKISTADMASVVPSIRTEVALWPAIGQASATFVSQVAPRFDALTSAVASGSQSAAASVVTDFKNFINSSSSSDISRLGANILDFDLDGVVNLLPAGS